MTTVVIDAGHGGYDKGSTYKERIEKEDTLKLTLAVGKILTDKGVNVIYTRMHDEYMSPIQRANEANKANADLFISIHRNSSQYPNTYSGTQTMVYDVNSEKVDLADNINEQLKKIGYTDLGVSIRPNMPVLKATKMPAVVAEVGFINSDFDNQLFDEKFDDIANAIATAILETIKDEELGEIPEKFYRVQVGAYKDYNNAENMLGKLLNDGFSAFITTQGDLYLVQVGGFLTKREAELLENKLKDKGYETVIVN